MLVQNYFVYIIILMHSYILLYKLNYVISSLKIMIFLMVINNYLQFENK